LFSKRRADCAPPLIADVRRHVHLPSLRGTLNQPVAKVEFVATISGSMPALPWQKYNIWLGSRVRSH
jgi:hypothetical protein